MSTIALLTAIMFALKLLGLFPHSWLVVFSLELGYLVVGVVFAVLKVIAER